MLRESAGALARELTPGHWNLRSRVHGYGGGVYALANDTLVFVDLTFVSALEEIASEAGSVKGFVIMTDEAHMPETSLPNVYCYETLLDV